MVTMKPICRRQQQETSMHLSDQPISLDVLHDKYALSGESGVDDTRGRIARALACAEVSAQRDAWAKRFLAAQQAGFIPSGRIAATAGTTLRATMLSCFVQPLSDSTSLAEGGAPPIYTALSEAAETLRLGGGVGYDFSPIRPAGALVASTRSPAAGPLAVLHLFDASSRLFSGGRGRRGAQMGVLRFDHPDIQAFAAAKAAGSLQQFNLSVGVTDAFMHALHQDGEVDLVHAAEPGPAQRAAGALRRADGLWVYRRVRAAAVWEAIVSAAYAVGEPGLLFLDRINGDDNLGWCEQLSATNPCGEQPLPPYGACCLGSIDLTRLVREPFEHGARLDFQALAALVPTAVRMLDNVLDLTAWPLPRQREEALATRRVGLGFTGLGDALVMLGLHYDSDAARELAGRIAAALRDAAYEASCDLALERGTYPRFNADGVLRPGSFASRLPERLRERVRRDGMRNSHLLAVAPAGSVSLAFADNVSNGIEPAYEWTYMRQQRHPDGSVTAHDVEDHAWRVFRRMRGEGVPLPAAFVHALELRPEAHLAMVAAVAPYIDAGISKTVNVVPATGREAFDRLYRAAWQQGLKGITAFRPNAVLGSVLWRRAAAPQAVTC
jgi:ribonucleoside-diphosphate reductase alpha chain